MAGPAVAGEEAELRFIKLTGEGLGIVSRALYGDIGSTEGERFNVEEATEEAGEPCWPNLFEPLLANKLL